MTTGEKRLNGPRCSGTTKAGEPCRALAGADGLCTAHSGKTDMRELGSRGGRSRRRGVAEQLPEAERASLREQLRRGLDPDLVVRTANEILAGENQTARGNMIRFLADLELYRKDGDECPRCAAWKLEGPAASARVNEMIARLVEHAVRQEFGGEERREGGDSQAMALVRGAVRRGVEGREEKLQDAVQAAVGRSSTRSRAASLSAMSSAPSRLRASSRGSRRSACSSRAAASRRWPSRWSRSACKPGDASR